MPTRPGACSQAVEKAGVFGGYLEDLCYTPKTLKAIKSVEGGAVGEVTWVRSREAHPGPHSAWFWDGRLTGGGAIVDLGCHCIEIIRNFVGKGNRPVEVLCHADTLVHPIGDEDNAVALIRFESGAIGQFEVSWTFRGGMDLRDEVAGTDGTIWLNHYLRTGFEMFTAGGGGGLHGREVRGRRGLDVSGRRRRGRAGLHRHVHRHVRSDRERPASRAKPSTTATWSTRSWTPASSRPPSAPGSRSSWPTGAAAQAARIGANREPETVDGKVVIKRELLPDGRLETDPEGPRVGRLLGRRDRGAGRR